MPLSGSAEIFDRKEFFKTTRTLPEVKLILSAFAYKSHLNLINDFFTLDGACDLFIVPSSSAETSAPRTPQPGGRTHKKRAP